jgi:hypothetical protein
MNGYETWGNLNQLARHYEPKPYVSPAEYQRLERVAVGKMCRCGSCYCCEEVRKNSQKPGNARK